MKVTGDIADIVHNLAETSARRGDYDQALGHYLRALELRRTGGDKRGAAIESYSMGTLFEYQGRFGAAVKAKEDALKTFQSLQDRSFWLAEILSGYGSALSQIGRAEDARKNLDDALTLARELNNQGLVAQTLGFQGERLFYQGDFRNARQLFDQATQAAAKLTDRNIALRVKLDAAKVSVRTGRSQDVLRSLRELAAESDRLGLKYLSLDSSLYLAQGLVAAKDYAAAQRELEKTVAASEKLSLRALLAESHHQLALVLRRTNRSGDADRHDADAKRIMEDIRKEAATDSVAQRIDLAPLLDASR
jgi:tetratricopeptide (TPR) repeat protein